MSRAMRLASTAAMPLMAPTDCVEPVARTIEIPGRPTLEIEHLLLDLNGTLTDRGVLIDGVGDRLSRLDQQLDLHALSADTFGTLDELTGDLHLAAPDLERR